MVPVVKGEKRKQHNPKPGVDMPPGTCYYLYIGGNAMAKEASVEFMQKMIEELREALKYGTASDPEYCCGFIAMLEDKISKAEEGK